MKEPVITKGEAKADEVSQDQIMKLVDFAIAKSLDKCPSHCRLSVSIKRSDAGLVIETYYKPKK
jgi:hypothetical protein|tara:strand:- start:1318 stop:1509 length:192 start_codon:yes stop_codon:yes gene_type:complete